MITIPCSSVVCHHHGKKRTFGMFLVVSQDLKRFNSSVQVRDYLSNIPPAKPKF